MFSYLNEKGPVFGPFFVSALMIFRVCFGVFPVFHPVFGGWQPGFDGWPDAISGMKHGKNAKATAKNHEC